MLKVDNTDAEVIERAHVAKKRRCLMCRTDFQSAHAGERVCSRCRQSKAWREGDMPSYGGRRG